MLAEQFLKNIFFVLSFIYSEDDYKYLKIKVMDKSMVYALMVMGFFAVIALLVS